MGRRDGPVFFLVCDFLVVFGDIVGDFLVVSVDLLVNFGVFLVIFVDLLVSFGVFLVIFVHLLMIFCFGDVSKDFLILSRFTW